MNLVNFGKSIQRYNALVSFTGNHCLTSPRTDSFRKSLNDLQVFCHHIYEYKKGLRNLVLTTERAENRSVIEKRLESQDIPYVIHEIGEDKINVFFGNQACINVVATFDPKLSKLSPEQDFILGIMLGYDRLQQCHRYLKMRAKGLKLDQLIG